MNQIQPTLRESVKEMDYGQKIPLYVVRSKVCDMDMY